MRYRINGVTLRPEEPEALLAARTAAIVGLPVQAVGQLCVERRSIDARRGSVRLVYAVSAELLRPPLKGDAQPISQEEEPPAMLGTQAPDAPIVVVGAGPCGLFAALELAEHGYEVVLLERGKCLRERGEDLALFARTRSFMPDSNALFGEGGAGAYSDGKLTARGKNPLARRVLQGLVQAGASPEILVEQKPHIGTDGLRKVIPNLTRMLQTRGVQVCFSSRVTGLVVENGVVRGLYVRQDGVERRMRAAAVILAVGHSARDTYQMLYESQVQMEAKPFAIGVRAEHPQRWLDGVQYGAYAGHPRLGAAEYALTAKAQDGRGVYTFCMCPGGVVTPSISEEGMLCINGMSNSARDGENANAAVVVQVGPKDFGPGVLAGVEYQRRVERAAYLVGERYAAPAQRVADYLSKTKSAGFGGVVPSYALGVVPASLWEVLPPCVANGIWEGLQQFDHKLHGYAMGDAVLTAPETRTSAPVRILRGKTGESLSHANLYPAGEGAGYAGGIVSAGTDGIGAARRVMQRFCPHHKAP